MEIHQSSPGSSDISFDLELAGDLGPERPLITSEPASRSVSAGANVTFNVIATGRPPLYFQWRFNGADLPGATSNLLMLANVQLAQAGDYRVLVTNVIGSAISQVAVLTVNDADRDGDGMPDAWEIANGTNPDAADAGADPDNDGLTTFQEYLAGTSPTNALSVLRIESVLLEGGGATTRISFNAVSNHTYTVQWVESLEGGAWQKLADVAASAANRVQSVTNATIGSSARYYRLVTPQQP